MSRSQRVDAFSLSALRFHLPLLVGVAVCIYAGWFELSRARAGHPIAWVYAFEWPGFAIVGVYIWWRIITNVEDSRPSGPRSGALEPDIPSEDPGLAAWQRYLADVQRRERLPEADAAD